MADDRKPIFRAFYRKLLRFYPRPFRERFGESMEQTFGDLCREQQGQTGMLLSLTVRVSFDTGIGIIKEHVLYFSKRRAMSSILKNPKLSLIVGVLLFLPGALVMSLLMLGIEPPMGPLKPYLEPPEGPHILGSLLVIAMIVVLPAMGVIISIGATQGSVLKSIVSNLAKAVGIGLLLVLPFIVLELLFGRSSYTSFPIPLFAILWLLPTMFLIIFIPLVQRFRAGKSLMANPGTLFLSVAFLVLIAVFWGGLVADQMPCFMGVPNCD